MLDLGVRKDFPVFESYPDLVFLDNAATTQKPKAVIEAEAEFYKKSYANIHRGTYDLAYKATEAFEGTRKKVAEFIGVKENEIVFTSNATSALNLAAHIEGQRLRVGDEIIVSVAGHHSNILPWQRVAKQTGAKVVWLELGERIEDKLSDKTRVIAIAQVTNVTGDILPIFDRERGIIRSVLDCAQSAGRMPIDVKELGVDYAAFSGHKLYGPTGSGWLYAKEDNLVGAEPLLVGGGTIKKVERDKTEWAEVPLRFEAGTPDIASVVGLGVAIDYLKKIGMREVWRHDKELAAYMFEELKKIKGLKIFGQGKTGVMSFRLDGVHSHDLAEVANGRGVAIRAGHHCAQLLMRALGAQEVTRASLGVYNTKEDVDRLAEAIEAARKKFS